MSFRHCTSASMAFISPNHRAYRYLVLFLICVLTFGGYYSYDLPGSLSYAYTDPSILNLSAFQYNLLYSVYSWPNTILPFFGGYISDRWLGIRASTILFAVLVACGQTLVSFGITAKSFVLIIIGRTVSPRPPPSIFPFPTFLSRFSPFALSVHRPRIPPAPV